MHCKLLAVCKIMAEARYQLMIGMLHNYVKIMDGNRTLIHDMQLSQRYCDDVHSIMQQLHQNVILLEDEEIEEVHATPVLAITPPLPPVLTPTNLSSSISTDSDETVVAWEEPTLGVPTWEEPMVIEELGLDYNEIQETNDFMNIFQEPDNSYVLEEDHSFRINMSMKYKPKLLSNRITIKQGRELVDDCSCCLEEYNKEFMVSFGCNHEFCVDCVSSHFHFSIKNQPYARFYSCPICRSHVTNVTLNYSKIVAKNKTEAMTGNVATKLKVYCR